MRLPPFGKILLAYQQESICFEQPIYIFVGNHAKEMAYSYKRMGTLCSFLPMGDDVSQYQWPIFRQKIVVQDAGQLSIRNLQRICFQLMNYKPKLIYLWSENWPCQFFKGVSHER